MQIQKHQLLRETWRHHRGPGPLLFSNSDVTSFTFKKNKINESTVRRDLVFLVLIRED